MKFAQTIRDLAIRVAMTAAVLWAVGFFLAGVWSLVSQAFDWLRFGYWVGLDSLTIVALLGGPAGEQWAMYPKNWFGVHQILRWLPQSCGFWVIAIAPLCALLAFTKTEAD